MTPPGVAAAFDAADRPPPAVKVGSAGGKHADHAGILVGGYDLGGAPAADVAVLVDAELIAGELDVDPNVAGPFDVDGARSGHVTTVEQLAVLEYATFDLEAPGGAEVHFITAIAGG